jgi:hypothetical protein
MKAKVAVYDTHEKAVSALNKLKEAGFPIKKTSLIGKAELIDDHMHVKSFDSIKNAPLAIGAIAGPIIGALSGIGIFAIPGFGFLFGAGAIIGAIGGFDLGIMGGGILSLLAFLGITKDTVVKYEEHINEGKFLLIVHGEVEEIEKAEHILHTEGTHLEIGN